MKKINKIIGLLFIAVFISCGNDDDNNSRSLDNAFTINGTNYETPNRHLVFHN